MDFVLLLLSIRDFRPVGVLKIVRNMKNKVGACIKMKDQTVGSKSISTRCRQLKTVVLLDDSVMDD
jgi:hypothetical protein